MPALLKRLQHLLPHMLRTHSPGLHSPRLFFFFFPPFFFTPARYLSLSLSLLLSLSRSLARARARALSLCPFSLASRVPALDSFTKRSTMTAATSMRSTTTGTTSFLRPGSPHRTWSRASAASGPATTLGGTLSAPPTARCRCCPAMSRRRSGHSSVTPRFAICSRCAALPLSPEIPRHNLQRVKIGNDAG